MAKMGFERQPIHIDWHNQPQEVMLGGKHCKFRSKQEYKWAQYLEQLKQLGAIIDWEYEPQSFVCETKPKYIRKYTPDFKVIEYDDLGFPSHHWQEVKVYLAQKDVTRFRMFKRSHPNEEIVLVLNSVSKKQKQQLLLQKAHKYITRVVYAGPIFRKFGIS